MRENLVELPFASQSVMTQTEEKKKEESSKEPEKKSGEKSLEEQLANLIVPMLTGASGISALKFLHEQKWLELAIASALTAVFGFARGYIQGLIGRDGKQLGEQTRKQLGQEADRRGKPGLSRQYLEAVEAYCYKLEIEGEDDSGLALEEIYVALRVISQRSQQVGLQSPKEIWKFLPGKGMAEKMINRRLVILAPPGYGKTTLMRHVALIYANGEWRDRGVREYLPVLLRFREIHSLIWDDQPPKLAELIAQGLINQPEFRRLALKSDWFEKRLLAGRCLVILDGLDEVPPSQRSKVRRWADREMRSYTKTPFILTSRPHGFDQLDDEPTVTVNVDLRLEVLPLTPDQKQQFVAQWYRTIIQREWDLMRQRQPIGRQLSIEQQQIQIEKDIEAKTGDLTRQIFKNLALNALAENPLLLTMIVKTHKEEVELPKSRVDIYEKIFSLILGKRASVKQMPLTLPALENKMVLQSLAWNLVQRETTLCGLNDAASWIDACLAACRKERTLTATNFLREIQYMAGLLQEKKPGMLEFSHPTFQEYLAARYLRELSDGESQLLAKLDNDRWEEVICFYAALGDASNLITALIAAPTGERVALARRCRDEGRSVEPHVIDKLHQIQSQEWQKLKIQEWEKLKIPAIGQPRQYEYQIRLETPQLQLEELEAEQLQLEAELTRLATQRIQFDATLQLEMRFTSGFTSLLNPQCMISHNPITWGEYYLLLRSQESGQFHSDANIYPKLPTFAPEQLAEIMDQDQQWFCAWIATQNVMQSHKALYRYRPATIEERQQIPKHNDGLYIVREEIPDRYRDLLNYLANARWRDADQATSKVMLEVAEKSERGYLMPEDLQGFPCPDLQIIDTLWAQFSGGNLGFSIQAKIWKECGSPISKNENWNHFVRGVGWKDPNLNSNGVMIIHSETLDLSSNPGKLPFLWDAFPYHLLFSDLFMRMDTCGFADLPTVPKETLQIFGFTNSLKRD
jgi:hypothetical protein